MSADPPASFDCNNNNNGFLWSVPPSPSTGTGGVNTPTVITPSPTNDPTPKPTVPATPAPTRTPLPDGKQRLAMVVTLDDRPAETGWKLSTLPGGKLIDTVAIGNYASSPVKATYEYEYIVDSDQFYHLAIYDEAGNGFAGKVVVYEDAIKTEENILVNEPGFSQVSGTEVNHGFYVGGTPESVVTVDLTFDFYPNEVAYELKNLNDGITLGMKWFESFGKDSKTATVSIPIYGPGRGNQKYEFGIWDAGEDGICCGFGNGKYELYLGTVDDNDLLTSGGEYGSGESFEFDVIGDANVPTPSPAAAKPSPSPILPIPGGSAPRVPPTAPNNTAPPFYIGSDASKSPSKTPLVSAGSTQAPVSSSGTSSTTKKPVPEDPVQPRSASSRNGQLGCTLAIGVVATISAWALL